LPNQAEALQVAVSNCIALNGNGCRPDGTATTAVLTGTGAPAAELVTAHSTVPGLRVGSTSSICPEGNGALGVGG
jgi:hypothetical protein